MNKTQQRLILIVAVILCGLAYGLQTWLHDDKAPLGVVDPVSRAMVLVLNNAVLHEALSIEGQYLVLSLAQRPEDPISAVQHTVMGGLGAVQRDVRAVQLVLFDATNGQNNDQWQQAYHRDYPNILQLFPPKKDIPAVLKSLRVCWQFQGDCARPAMQSAGSRFVYVLDGRDLSVLYYGDMRWGALALVQDIQVVIGRGRR
ncbi:MAG: hypothetical protein HRT36_09180 [Alphaproteobacteria bacterium]|nr:hypothetical protein [Alphaproteobacteria bacterium]